MSLRHPYRADLLAATIFAATILLASFFSARSFAPAGFLVLLLVAAFLLGMTIAHRNLGMVLLPVIHRIRAVAEKCTQRNSVSRSGKFSRDASPDDGAPFSQLETIFDRLETSVNGVLERDELLSTHIAASIVIFTRERGVLFLSPFTEVLTGYEIEELYQPGRLFELIVDEDRDKFERAWGVALLGEDYSVRYQVRHRSGLKLWLETRLVPLLNESETVSSVLCVTIDVTESVNHQRQIEDHNRDLSDFSYMVSHDLKAPIFTIKGMAAALAEDYGTRLGNDGRELLQYILDAAKRLEVLTASVIEYSAVATQDEKDNPVELSDVIENVLRDFAEQIRKAGAGVHVEGTLPTVRGDPVRYYQVFSNLVGNAIKYRSPDRPCIITIRSKSAGRESALVEVADNGMGIPAVKISDIFRPYHRAHGPEIEGSGIGLACVKKIVDRVGGSVSAISTEHEGSLFSVILPVPLRKPQSIPDDLARYYESDGAS